MAGVTNSPTSNENESKADFFTVRLLPDDRS
jgi:hypothetical protein